MSSRTLRASTKAREPGATLRLLGEESKGKPRSSQKKKHGTGLKSKADCKEEKAQKQIEKALVFAEIEDETTQGVDRAYKAPLVSKIPR